MVKKNPKKLKIFISSVFFEEGKDWNLRKEISTSLNKLGHETWLWEENGVDEQKKSFKNWCEIISEAILASDLVVTFYKNRAGDLSFFHKDIPFLPTDYEIALAIKTNTPVYLYFIKGYSVTYELKGVRSLFFNKIIVQKPPTFCNSESEFIPKVISDVNKLTSPTEIISIITLEDNVENFTNWIENALFETSLFLNINDYKTAYKVIESATIFSKVIPQTKQEKTLLARYFANCAKIHANQANYKKAIVNARKSIRLLLEIGEWNEVFSQIQALSGIQNMAGFKSAKYLNEYGIRSVRNFKNLQIEYNDSKASILRDLGYYNEALKLIEKDWDNSTYSAAKYAHLIGFSSQRNSLDIARSLLEETILPKARDEEKYLAYVLRESAIIAIKDNDLDAANNYLNESEYICQEMGMLHIKKSILNIRFENKLF